MGAFAYEGHTQLLDPEPCELCGGMGWLDAGPCVECHGRGKLALARLHTRAEGKKILMAVERNGGEGVRVEVEMTPDEARRFAVDLLRDVGLIVDGVG